MTGKTEALIAHLAGGTSVAATAQLTGVSESTIYRKMRTPEFKARLQRARDVILDRSLGHLAKGAPEASITLRKLLKAKSDNVKLGAARTLLEMGMKARDQGELVERIEALELTAKGKQ